MILNIWGTLASIAIMVSYIPQLKQTFKTKNVEGQNINFWLPLTFSVGYFLANATISGAGIITILAQLFNFIGAGSMLVMVYKYKNNTKKDYDSMVSMYYIIAMANTLELAREYDDYRDDLIRMLSNRDKRLMGGIKELYKVTKKLNNGDLVLKNKEE